MRRTDVLVSVAVAFLLVAVAVVGSTGLRSPIGPILDLVLRYWYLGVALVTASLLLRWRMTLPRAARVLGVAGVIWVTFVIGLWGLLLLFLFTGGPIGP